MAKLAGMPQSIVRRADEVLKQLEANHGNDLKTDQIAKPRVESGVQLSFFQLDDPVLCQVRDEIMHCDINNLTPVDALNKLNEIKKIITGRG